VSPRPRVLLTGGSGFIGSRVIEPLLDAGYEVHALGRAVAGTDRVVSHLVDLLDANEAAIVAEQVAAEQMLHLAWYAEHGRFWESPENLSWVGASLSLLRAFVEAGGQRVVIAGTGAEYDWSKVDEPCLELPRGERAATPLRPSTLYGTAKHATYLVASAYAEQVGLSLAWGRIFLVYGPGEDQRRLLPSVTRALLDGRDAPTSDGAQIRDLMHVDDVARGFAALLASELEGPVNVASGEGVSIRQVCRLISEAAGRPDRLRLGALPRRPGEPESLVADVARLREEVGFHPAVDLDQGIADAVNWWRNAA
jgi:nucleoside-diphosphate-sugar epimerase